MIPRLRPLALEDPAAFKAHCVARNTAIVDGKEGPAMSWLVASAAASQDVAAIARWERVANVCATDFAPATEAAFGGDAQTAFFNNLKLMHRKVMHTRPHFCLHILATLPECQGKGAASALLRHMTALADADALPLYVEAAPGSVHVYEKFGFVGVDKLSLPFLKDHEDECELIMVREPVHRRI